MNELKLAMSPSIEQLREWIRCDGVEELDDKIPARSYYEIAPEMMKMVHRYIKTDQAELALILIFKFMRFYLKKILKHKDFGRVPLDKLSQTEDTLLIVLPLASTIEELLIRKFAAQQHELGAPSLEKQRTLPMINELAVEHAPTIERNPPILSLLDDPKMSFLGPKLLQDITNELGPDRAGPLGKEMNKTDKEEDSTEGQYEDIMSTGTQADKERQVRGSEANTSSKQLGTDKESFLEQYRQRQKLKNMNRDTRQRTLKLAQELEEKGRQSACALQRCECRVKELIQDARASRRRWSEPLWTGSKTPIDVDARASSARHKAETLARMGLKYTLGRWDPPKIFDVQLKTIILPKDLIRKFKKNAKKNTKMYKKQTIGFLFGSAEHDSFLVSHLFIPQQENSLANCGARNHGDVNEFSLKNDLLPLGWIHTHPLHGSFMTSVDLHDHFVRQRIFPEDVCIVCGETDQKNRVFHLTEDGMKILSACMETGFHRHPDNFTLCRLVRHVQVNNTPLSVVDVRHYTQYTIVEDEDIEEDIGEDSMVDYES